MTPAAHSVMTAIWDRRLCLVCITVAAEIPPRGVADALALLSEADLVTTYDSCCARCGGSSLVFRAWSVGGRAGAIPDVEVAQAGASAA